MDATPSNYPFARDEERGAGGPLSGPELLKCWNDAHAHPRDRYDSYSGLLRARKSGATWARSFLGDRGMTDD